jgi:hypothetical protein
VRSLLISLAVFTVLGAAGWGVVVQRVTDDEGDVQRAEPSTNAEIEQFARFHFPASARGLKLEEQGGIDHWLSVTFEIDRADVEPLVASSGMPVQRLPRELRGEQDEPGYARRLTIRMHRPGAALVHLTAFTL